jgi:DNA (cytosine-5)-methyltransferase 1
VDKSSHAGAPCFDSGAGKNRDGPNATRITSGFPRTDPTPSRGISGLEYFRVISPFFGLRAIPVLPGTMRAHMQKRAAIPVIDLFAGPGGLSEGFASIVDERGARRFAIKCSIEKDEAAHRTLALRALYRSFEDGQVPDAYYEYLRGEISREELFAHPAVADHGKHALQEARCAELGKTPHKTIDGWIKEALGNASEWILIGGPPCQAYSLAGRSRLRGKDPAAFESDKRHFLYTEYLRIIREFSPSVFIMENVKGMLNSKHGGSPIFERILSDLRAPSGGQRYAVRSLVVDGDEVEPLDYLIESENYGVPQCRHRVILFGVRSDLARSWSEATALSRFKLHPASKRISVNEALSGLPPLRARLSQQQDSHAAWRSALRTAPESLRLWRMPIRSTIEEAMREAWLNSASHASAGGRFDSRPISVGSEMPWAMREWVHDPRLGGVSLHESRKHMRSDLHRYLFASCFAASQGYSPKIRLFPPKLLPLHSNMLAIEIPFLDRFRVQLAGEPSTTVVSHIAKDGHYYIHPDPSQCRSLTVREAARLQTFPDNYFFEGTRTQQFSQVGNAVPPLLARQIAEVVSEFMSSRR